MTENKIDDHHQNNKAAFDAYLLKEYESVAEAHFNTIETISAFFKNYLLIMTIPITLIGLFLKDIDNTPDVGKVISNISSYAGGFFIIIAIAGVAVMLYVMNLRFDSLLYARTVNGIRKHFYDNSSYDLEYKLRVRILPQTASQPSYFEGRFFLPVIFVFYLFNTLYGFIGLKLLIEKGYDVSDAFWIFYGSLSLIVHVALYSLYSRHRETGYLKSWIIGIDIDGVLNKHRDYFCKLLREKTGKTLDPDAITQIPVHELEVGIDRTDEKKVFNSPEYWTDMPMADNTPENIRKLKNVFKFKIFIFTYRPWPNNSDLNKSDKHALLNLWRQNLRGIESKVYSKDKNPDGHLRKILNKLCCKISRLFINIRKDSIVNRMTTMWLRLNNFEYNKLVVEKGNEDVSHPRGHFVNRFQISRKNKIRFFVEDDLEKAVKLSFICDVVFLLDHPYNKPQQHIPSNIIRVNSWNEIYKNIRKLS